MPSAYPTNHETSAADRPHRGRLTTHTQRRAGLLGSLAQRLCAGAWQVRRRPDGSGHDRMTRAGSRRSSWRPLPPSAAPTQIRHSDELPCRAGAINGRPARRSMRHRATHRGVGGHQGSARQARPVTRKLTTLHRRQSPGGPKRRTATIRHCDELPCRARPLKAAPRDPALDRTHRSGDLRDAPLPASRQCRRAKYFL